MPETQGRVLRDTQVGKYTLLNDEKLGRVLDLLEGITEPKSEEASLLATLKAYDHNDAVLALYDRYGGAIKLGEREIQIGTFYDFAAREPKKVEDIKEADYEDEYVLLKKKTNKKKKVEDIKSRIKRLEGRAVGIKPLEEDEEDTEEVEEKPKRGRPFKK